MTPVRLAQVLEVLYVCESNFEYKVLLNCCCLLMCCAVYMKTVACTGCVAIVVVDINVDRGAEYCDERFCLCVCARVCVCLSVHDHVFGTTGPIFTKCFLHVIYGHGSDVLWWPSDTLHNSSFMDDVIFAHKLRLLDVAARLRQ